MPDPLLKPYRGLVPFAEEHADFFFGREKETHLITARLFAARLSLLYGQSGVGKSSVLHAGVIHRLRERKDLLLVYFRDWPTDPHASFLTCVKEACDKAGIALQANGSHTICEVLRGAVAADPSEEDRRIFIICDQFEEFFTYHRADTPFAVELIAAINDKNLPLRCMFALREDALASLDAFKDNLPGLFEKRLSIAHLSRAAAEEAIRKPLDVYNQQSPPGGPVVMDDELISEILDSVGANQQIFAESGTGSAQVDHGSRPIEAPYLQLVLTKLWDQEEADGWPHRRMGAGGERRLAIDTLRKLGGAEEIVRSHLDAVMAKFDETQKAWATRMFDYLVMPSKTKIAQSLGDLATKADAPREDLRRMLDRLSQGDDPAEHSNDRILRTVAPTADAPDEPRYEIYHDRLSPAVLHWVAERKKAEATAAESVKAEEARKATVLAEKLAAQEAELRKAAEEREEQERQTSLYRAKVVRRQWVLIACMALLAIAAVIAAFYASQQKKSAETKSKEAEAARKDAEAASENAKRAQLAEFELKEKANELARSNEELNNRAQKAIASAEETQKQLTVAADNLNKLASAVAAGDLKHLASVVDDLKKDGSFHEIQTLTSRLGQTLSNARLLMEYKFHTSPIRQALFSPDGGRIVTVSDDSVQVWDPKTGDKGVPLSVEGVTPVMAAFDRDGNRLAVAYGTKGARLYKLPIEEGQKPVTMWTNTQLLAFIEDENLITAGPDRKIVIWSLDGNAGSTDAKAVSTISVEGPAKALASYDGNQNVFLACIANDVPARVWNCENGKPSSKVDRPLPNTPFGKAPIANAVFAQYVDMVTLSQDGTLARWKNHDPPLTPAWRVEKAHAGPSVFMETNNGGTQVLTAGEDGTIKVWDLYRQAPVEFHTTGGKLYAAKFSLDGRWIAAACENGTVELWENTSTPKLSFTLGAPSPTGDNSPAKSSNAVRCIGFSKDKRYLVSGGDDHIARVWLLDPAPLK